MYTCSISAQSMFSGKKANEIWKWQQGGAGGRILGRLCDHIQQLCLFSIRKAAQVDVARAILSHALAWLCHSEYQQCVRIYHYTVFALLYVCESGVKGRSLDPHIKVWHMDTCALTTPKPTPSHLYIGLVHFPILDSNQTPIHIEF